MRSSTKETKYLKPDRDKIGEEQKSLWIRSKGKLDVETLDGKCNHMLLFIKQVPKQYPLFVKNVIFINQTSSKQML